MKQLLLLLLACCPLLGQAKHRILSPNVKTLQVVVNQEWTSMPVMTLNSDDMLNVAFDELSHNYHRFVAHLEHCEADWSVSEELFESDWLQGFNNLIIDDYENSMNTTVLYTHYRFQIPNDECQLRMSGNYRLRILDDDNDQEEVLTIEFRVVEPLVNVGLGITTNTDIGLNSSYQQVAMSVNYNTLRVTNQDEQIQTFVLQNGREDNMKQNVRPNYNTATGLTWEHNRGLIFEAGNEYRKFEVLDPSHPTMGLGYVTWDEEQGRFHAFPFFAEPRRSYIYDQDANGAFLIRNSDNVEIDYTSDYVLVHYKLKPQRRYPDARILIDGRWTIEPQDNYVMEWDEEDQSYNAVVLQKLGYYNYQLLMADFDGTTHLLPEEGSFYQTENSYTALVYYKGTGERSWRLVGVAEANYKNI